MKKVKYLIIGGGISGLQLANELKEDFLLIEKEDSLGGYCRSFYQDGFVWDYGGHFFHGDKINIKDFSKREGVLLKNKSTKIYFGDRYIDFPFQNHINQLTNKDYKYCLNTYNNRNINVAKENFLSKLYSNYGEGIVELFLRPYNEKLYACNLTSLDVDAMGRFFPSKSINLNDNVKSYNDTYYASRNGAQEYIRMLLETIDINKIILNCKCERIDYLNKIVDTNKGKIQYETLINTIPFNKFLEIYNKDKYEDIKDVFSYNKVAIFNLGFDKESNNEYHWIYYPQDNISFYRVGFYNNIFESNKMSLYVEVGLKSNEEINKEEKLEVILNDLRNVGIVTDQKLISYKCLIADPGYVHITKESINMMNTLKKELKENNIYTIGRYGGWTYSSIGDCISEAKELVESIK